MSETGQAGFSAQSKGATFTAPACLLKRRIANGDNGRGAVITESDLNRLELRERGRSYG